MVEISILWSLYFFLLLQFFPTLRKDRNELILNHVMFIWCIWHEGLQVFDYVINLLREFLLADRFDYIGVEIDLSSFLSSIQLALFIRYFRL